MGIKPGSTRWEAMMLPLDHGGHNKLGHTDMKYNSPILISLMTRLSSPPPNPWINIFVGFCGWKDDGSIIPVSSNIIGTSSPPPYLLRLHRALVRSVLDYGSLVYGCASATNLRTLDTVHHAGIRLATGAFCTSRIDCLLVDAGEPSLSMRRDILLCSYSAKISGFPNHPTYRSLLHPQYKSSYVDRPSLLRPPGIRLVSLLQDLNISLPKPVPYPHLTVPPWTLLHPMFDFRLTAFSKTHTCSSVFQLNFQEILSSYTDYTFIYTDGSANNESVACAFCAWPPEYTVI